MILCTLGVYIRAANVIFHNWRRIRRAQTPSQRDLQSWGDEYAWSDREAAYGRSESHDTRGDQILDENNQADQGLAPNWPPTLTVSRSSSDGPHEQAHGRRLSFPSVLTPRTHSGTHRRGSRRGSFERHSATWAYSKYAMLFFISLFVTWVSLLSILYFPLCGIGLMGFFSNLLMSILRRLRLLIGYTRSHCHARILG